MESLDAIRMQIDDIDQQLQVLLMRRMDCSYKVAEAKAASGDRSVYRAEREAAILEKLGADVSQERKAAYLSVVRKVMQSSRSYQYNLMCDWDPSLFAIVEGHELAEGPTSAVRVRMTRACGTYALSDAVSAVGDCGLQLESLKVLDAGSAGQTVSLELLIQADISLQPVRALMYQLACESVGFAITECIR